MKKLFTFIVGAVVGLGAYAQDFDSGGLRYSVLSPDDKTCAVTGFSESTSELVIPETVSYEGEDYTVTEIGYEAFRWNWLRSLSLPSTLEVIGGSAFWNCNGLKEVVIPNSVKEIGEESFRACYDLNRVVLGTSVEVIKSRAFTESPINVVVALGETPAQFEYDYLNAITTNPLVGVSEDLVAKYQAAWEGANVVSYIEAENLSIDPANLQMQPGGTGQLNCIVTPSNAPVKFPTWNSDLITVDDNGLVTANNLQGDVYVDVTATSLNGLTATCTIYIEPLTEIKDNGFVFVVIPNAENEVALMRYESDDAVVNIPGTLEYNGNVYDVTTIGPSAFSWNGSIEEVIIPASVKLISKNNFNYCSSLKKVTIEDSSTTLQLSNYNFADDSNLAEVYVGRNLAFTEGDYCFYWDYMLSRIVLGSEVTSVPANLFDSCWGLSLIVCLNPEPPVIGAYTFGSNGSLTIIVPAESVEAYREAWEQYASYIIDTVNADQISFDTDEVTLYNGQGMYLPRTVEPEGATVLWSSSNPDLVSVDRDGYVNYHWWTRGVGEAVITASSVNGVTAECKVIAKHWLTFQEDKVSMANGETYQVEVTKPEEIAESPITWTSFDEAVATVDENGLITAVAGGNAEIVAEVNVPRGEELVESISYSIEVEVRSMPEAVSAEDPVIEVWIDETAPIRLNFVPNDEFVNSEMTWTVADSEIVEVYSYTHDMKPNYGIRGLKAGKTTITGTTVNGLTVEIEVVVKTWVEQITFPNEVVYLSPGESAELEFTTIPEETYQHFRYDSDNTNVATVNEEGLITAQNPGSAFIYVFDEHWNWLGYQRVVVDYFPETVTLVDDYVQVVNRNESRLNLVFTPDDANVNKEMSWMVEDPEIADIWAREELDEETGQYKMVYVVYGRGIGTTTFTGTTLNGLTVTGTVSVEGLDIYYGSKESREVYISVGETIQLGIDVNPEEILNTLELISYDEGIFTVTPDGQVTGVAPGENWLDAKYTLNGNQYYDDIWVVVNPAPGTISLNKSTLVMRPGDWYNIKVRFPLDEAYDITWSCETSEAGVIDIYSYGDELGIYGLGIGTATITATASNGATATCEVICANPAMNESNIVMGLDQTRKLEVLGLPEGLDVYIDWWTENYDVANVSDGVITPQNYGSTRIYANVMTSDGLWIGQASTYVDVIDWIYVSEITLDPTKIEINYMGQRAQIYATVYPEDATDKTLYWTSSDESVAVVNEYGLVTILGHGTAVITATAADGSGVTAECVVADPPVLVQSIELSNTFLIGYPGDSFNITATVSPYDATDKTVLWSSSKPEVASVDEYGNVTAIMAGSAVITATAADGSGVTAECKVRVMSEDGPDIPMPDMSIEISNEDWEAKVGETLQLEVEITPLFMSGARIYWSTSDESVATVDYKGLVTAVGAGEAVITAKLLDGSGLSAECHVKVTEASASDPNGVAGLDADAIVDVYTQQGILIKHNCTAAELKELQSGIYIIRSGNTVKTVYLRN